ncbi:MAG TPA: hypothetical protein VHV29_17580 [Terriglobales bacterium]|jgi:hypothetical protein|nr:hypothetical protein [Terriglobales bacterium]
MLRKYLIALTAIIFLVAQACTKQAPTEPAKPTAPTERIPSLAGTSQTILQKTFTLNSSTTFPFEIPAHAMQPHLHGIFESFVGKLHGPSDDRANVEFMILNQEQEDALSGNRASDALFSAEASHNQAVNLDLPPSMNQPVKYYLVFRNPDGVKTNKAVNANFRVDF